MNPLYNQYVNNGVIPQSSFPQQYPTVSGMQFQNPVQRMNYIIQAMRNPAAFIRQNIPQIPEQAFNDPTGNGVLQYMMQNMGVTQQDIQRASAQIPQF